MKFYTYDPAPNPRRVQLLINYKGINIESEQVDMMTGAHMSDEFRAINPVMTLPTLVLDNGDIMTEVPGICMYLESLNPDKPLMGTTDLEKAEIISWDHKLYISGFSAIAEILRNSSKAFKNRAIPGPLNVPQIPDLISRGQMRLDAFFTDMEAHLTSRNYVVGNNLSLADIDLYVIVEFSGWVKASIPDTCPNMQAWCSRIKVELGE